MPILSAVPQSMLTGDDLQLLYLQKHFFFYSHWPQKTVKLGGVKETLFSFRLSTTPGDVDVDRNIALRNNLLFMPEILLQTNKSYKSDRSALVLQIIICVRTL